ncbi:MAG: DUF4136 domain-containing protein [Candidatus Omnitrophica bacterium]|nr:DUF4136 domain-containing protein [Candidatus Omnitrophota bacterium]
MKRILASLFICLAITLASGCATIQKPTYMQAGSMEGLKSYAWLNDTHQIDGEIRTDKYSLDAQIKKSIDDALSSKGYVKVAKERADFYINYKLSILTENKVMFNNEVSPEIKEMDRGSMMIEAVDARSKTLIWQGEQRAKVYRYDFVDNRISFVKNSIRQILNNFPSEE